MLLAVHARDDGILVKLSMPASRVKLLTKFRAGDLVTEILRSVTLKTVVFGRAELRTPWGLEVDLPGRAVFHIVLRGECFFRAPNANFIHLSRGDTILFPQADVHHLADHSATPTRPLQELMIEHPMTPDRRFRYGGQGPRTTLLCGAFRFDDPRLNLMGVLLPPLLHIPADNGASTQLRALTRCIEAELKVSQPGEQAIVTRMAEAFLLRAIRDHVIASSNSERGLPAILRDPGMMRVLEQMHRNPERPWTVAALAKTANLSRSAFAARFKMRVGVTPQSYLQRYRFGRAVQLLQNSDAKLYEIGRSVGYDSESSFSKAFKRLMGRAPGAYRGSSPAPLRNPATG